MKKLNVTINGASPLLLHSYKGNDNPDLKNMTPEQQAEFATYRSVNGNLVLPSSNIHRAFISGAGKYSKKGIGGRVAGAVWLEEFEVDLGTKDFVVDSRGVVVMKARIIRHRPRLNGWSASFTLNYDETLISEKELRKIVIDTGALVGIGDFRPEKKGPFGRFTATFN